MEKERREKIKIALSDTERKLIERKAHMYGYQYISTYVRDACIYENIVCEEMTGKQEILATVGELISSIENYTNFLKQLGYTPNIDKNEIRKLDQQNEELLEKISELKGCVLEKLHVSFQKKNLREKLKQESLDLGGVE